MSNTLTIVNASSSIPRLAIYKKSYNFPNLGLIAWKVAAPGPEGLCSIAVPLQFDVYVSMGGENDPYGGCRSRTITLPTFTANINVVARPVDDNTTFVPDLVQTNQDLVPNQINISNNFTRAVWGHILADGTDIYPPQLISPNEVLMADVRPSFFVAHVSEFVRKGDRLVEAELSQRTHELMVGQTLIVSGSRMDGFILQTQA